MGLRSGGRRLEIFETFGPVKNPFYSLSTNSEQGQLIFVEHNNQSLTSYMLTAELMKCVCVRGVCAWCVCVCMCVCVCVSYFKQSSISHRKLLHTIRECYIQFSLVNFIMMKL